MTNETNTNSRPARRWVRWTGIILGGLVVLLLVAYFVGTSEWAFKSVILPKVSQGMNAQVTVEGASISPFSSVLLRGLKVQTVGTEPLVTAQEVRARYSLMDIIKGRINVSQVEIKSPVVNLMTYPDGTSNLDPFTKQPKDAKPKSEPKSSAPGAPPQLHLQNFTLTDATIRKIDQRKDGTRQTMVVTVPSMTLNNLGNDQVAKLVLAASLRLDQGLNSTSNGVIAATIGGQFDLALDAALQPKTVKGQTKLDVTEAQGVFQQAAALGVTLNADLTPTELKDVSVRIAQGGKNLGALTVSGPMDAQKREGKLAVVLSQIDRQLLNLAGAASGLDFNQTTISATNLIELTQGGHMVAVNGTVLVGSFSVTQQGQTTPALDLRTGYSITLDQSNQTALVQAFTLSGGQGGAEFLRGTLAKPMRLELGKASGAVDESAFDLVITNFNLADWRAFAGTNVNLTSGKLGVNLQLVSQQAGKKLSLNLATQLRELTAAAGSNRIENADITFATRGTVSDFSAVNLESFRAELLRGGRSALLANGAVQYNTKSQDADVQVNLETSLPEVTALVSAPGLSVSAGTVKFAGRVVQKNTTPQQTNNPVLDRSVTGKLNLDGFTGVLQSNRFDRFVTAVDLDVATHGDAVDIRKCAGRLEQAGQAGGAFEVAGQYNLATKVGNITAKLVELNQNALKSFLAAALGDKQLESVVINSTTTAKLDGPTDFAVKTEFHLANLVVNDPSGAVPRTPLGVDVVADVAMTKQVIELRTVQLALAKTERAPNSLNVAGRVDLSKSNAITGNVKLTSDGLDVTPYYELFAKKSAATSAPGDTKPTPEVKPQTGPEVEPEPMKLPVSQFTFEANIAKFFLREVAVSNLITKTVIENGRVNVNPFSLTLNGGAVNLTALVNLAVRGYEYDVTAKLDRVPVEPLVNTFAPDKRGQVKGDLLTSAQIKGAGITGAGLQKNLTGAVSFSLTNANVQISQSKRLHQILVPIGAVLRVPQLSESPLTWVDARTTMGQGTVMVQGVTAESSVFRAGLAGTISLADVLTNSTLNKLPVDLELRRNVSDAARLTPPGTATNVEFVALPKFVSLAGTVGKPKTDIDKVAVTRLLAGAVGNYLGGDAGKLLRGLGNLGGATTTTSTNATGTNASGNARPGLGNLLEKPARTNAATTNAPAKKKKGGLNLNDFLK